MITALHIFGACACHWYQNLSIVFLMQAITYFSLSLSSFADNMPCFVPLWLCCDTVRTPNCCWFCLGMSVAGTCAHIFWITSIDILCTPESDSTSKFIVYTQPKSYINNGLALTFRVYHLWTCLIYDSTMFCTSFVNCFVELEQFVPKKIVSFWGFELFFDFVWLKVYESFQVTWKIMIENSRNEKWLNIFFFIIPDCPELNASISTANTLGSTFTGP